jgi:hypothetical protein
MVAAAGTFAAETVASRSRWRKWLVWASIALLFVLALALWFVFTYLAHQRELREAVAVADRLDPGWRFEDLEAARAEVLDAENGALQLEAAYRLLPARWFPALPASPGSGIDEVLDELPANQPLDKKRTSELRTALKAAAAALTAGRRLADFPRGRYKVAWTQDRVSTVMPHVDHLNAISRLLYLDSVVRAQDGDTEGAVRSCQAALNACRSVGDEPAFVSQASRLGLGWARPLQGLERVLAKGEPSNATLEEFQGLVRGELSEPSLILAARAERAMTYQFLEVLRARKLDRRAWGLANPYGLPDGALNWMEAARADRCEAAYLRYLTELVEIMKLPAAERGPRLETFQRPIMALPQILQSLMGQLHEKKACLRLLKGQARFQCALAGLAVERYRIANGRWPGRLEDLVPAYLDQSPTDPLDGAPLSYAPTGDGVAITAGKSGVTFRLWDVKKRAAAGQ